MDALPTAAAPVAGAAAATPATSAAAGPTAADIAAAPYNDDLTKEGELRSPKCYLAHRVESSKSHTHFAAAQITDLHVAGNRNISWAQE